MIGWGQKGRAKAPKQSLSLSLSHHGAKPGRQLRGQLGPQRGDEVLVARVVRVRLCRRGVEHAAARGVGGGGGAFRGAQLRQQLLAREALGGAFLFVAAAAAGAACAVAVVAAAAAVVVVILLLLLLLRYDLVVVEKRLRVGAHVEQQALQGRALGHHPGVACLVLLWGRRLGGRRRGAGGLRAPPPPTLGGLCRVARRRRRCGGRPGAVVCSPARERGRPLGRWQGRRGGALGKRAHRD
jgi:hypothetical protein